MAYKQQSCAQGVLGEINQRREATRAAKWTAAYCAEMVGVGLSCVMELVLALAATTAPILPSPSKRQR